uniref:GLOBIN domain-containing protein n=1 Tax=Angiostrongylus cantonensis TaxID=6313 RepID=A0A0K0CU26_ANGCA
MSAQAERVASTVESSKHDDHSVAHVVVLILHDQTIDYLKRTRIFSVNESVSGLSRSEKRMIKICWLKCSQKQLKKCAEDIFSDILHRDQTLLKLFKLELTPPSRLRSNEFFKSHAGNFAIVLNSVAINIGENFQKTCEALKEPPSFQKNERLVFSCGSKRKLCSSLDDLVQILGYQHAALKSRGFQTAYWDIFTDCFEQNRPASFRKEKEKEVCMESDDTVYIGTDENRISTWAS